MSVRGATIRFMLVLAFVAPSACRGESARQRWEQEEGEVDQSWTPDALEQIMGVPGAAVQRAIESRLAGERPDGIEARDWDRVPRMYEAYDGVSLWLEADGLGERAEHLASALVHAPSDGLALAAYPLREVREHVAALLQNQRPTAEELANIDVLLSTVYAALAADMFRGQIDPHSVSQGWHVDAREADVDSAIVHTLRLDPLDRGIARMRPRADDFDGLRRELRRYREIVARGGWNEVPDGEVLEPGDTSTVARLEALQARLVVDRIIERTRPVEPLRDTTGAATDRALYDAEVAGAVARFQARHGIVVDSILGPGTLSSLNASAEFRLRQIAGNLERYRWLPRTLGDRYVFVNVPAFRLQAFEGGRPAQEMKVIVGAEYNERATPAFSDSMSYVVFRPYWNIPENIAIEEVLPAAYANPAYMASRNYEVVRGWGDDAPAVGQYPPSAAAISAGEVRIRQRPGNDNALGLVKFMFPNDFAIYLHDTPEDDLFERDVRAFSHGCIRVEDPVALARFALGWDERRIREAMTSGADNQRVDLERKLPVYIIYLTTYMRDGELWFGNDLYERDRALTRVVARAAMPDPDLVREAEELLRLVQR